jgi:hypothetical protein
MLVLLRLFGVNSADPFTLGAAAFAVVLLCVVASLVPALGAARTDAVRSLRID